MDPIMWFCSLTSLKRPNFSRLLFESYSYFVDCCVLACWHGCMICVYDKEAKIFHVMQETKE